MAVIKLTTYVANLANVMGLFDKLRFLRSTSGEGGPYVEITANSPTPALIITPNSAPFDINAATLKLKVDNGAEQEVTFASANPVSVDLAISEINDQTTGLVASEDAGSIVLTSDITGTLSNLEITGGTSLTEFGFSIGDADGGQDADLTLVAGTTEYEYDDQNGDVDNYYKSQYVNSSTGTFSSLSDPVQGNVSTIIPTANLITAKIDLSDVDGTPLADVPISIHNVYVPPLIVSDIGVLGKQVEIVTDNVGHAETQLLKGATVDVAIAGTQIIRRIEVPSTGTEFNLMDEVAAADDLFQIQTPDIPAAVRRS
jgi:hypothetical protein